jgi:hypothetical protein
LNTEFSSRLATVQCLLCAGTALLLAHSVALGQTDVSASDLAAGFERASAICREVEKIRGLAFKNDVTMAAQSVEKFKEYVNKAVERQFGETGSDGYVRALVKIGVLKESVDLPSMVMTILEDQAVAYYDPDERIYHLLSTNVTPYVFDFISSHELCHALQDQHFDLNAFVRDDIAAILDNGDASLARECVIEGEATLVMIIWTLMREMGLDDPRLAEPLASVGISCQAGMDFDTLMELSQANLDSSDSGLAGIQGSASLADHPRFFVEQFLASYLQGAFMVDQVRTRSGWKGVSELYRNPPESMEQVLHPEKMFGEKDSPTDIRLPELVQGMPEGWSLVEEDVLGEFGIRSMLCLWQEQGAMDTTAAAFAAGAAAGWDGDRYYYLAAENDKADLLVWKTVWDSRQDASEFAVAYRALLATRFPAMKKVRKSQGDAQHPYQVWEVAPGRFLKLMSSGDTVGIIDTTDPVMLDVMWE